MQRTFLLLLVFVGVSFTHIVPARAATDAEHVARLNQLLDSKTTDCKLLNPPYFAARDFPNPSPGLKAALANMFVHRERHSCLVYKCPQGQTCRPPNEKIKLSDHFDSTRNELAACLKNKDCTAEEQKRLRDNLLTTVIVIVRRYGENAPIVKRVLEEIGIVIRDDQLLQRCAELLGKGTTPPEEAIKILRSILGQDGEGAVAKEIWLEVTRILEKSGGKLDAETRAKLFKSIGQLLRAHNTKESVDDLAALAKEVSLNDGGGRLLLLLQAARDLKLPRNRQALALAVNLILKRHPNLDKEVRASLEAEGRKTEDLQARLVSLARIMSEAEITELHLLREAAHTWQVVFASERTLRVLAVNRPPEGCPGQKDNPTCRIAEQLWNAFLVKLNGKAVQGAEEASVREGVPSAKIIELARRLLESDSQRGGEGDKAAGGSCSEEERKEFGELCVGPYVGVYVFEAKSLKGTNKVCGHTYYVVRGTDYKLSVAGKGINPVCADSVSDATVGGESLAKRVLQSSTLDKYAEWMGLKRLPPPPPPSWQKWATLGTLIGGGAAAITGVYVSNTDPESAWGDHLWQGGLVLLTSSLVFHIWDIVDD